MLRLSVERSRNAGIVKCHRNICTLKHIRCTCDNLKKSIFILAGCFRLTYINTAYYQLVSIGMLLYFLDSAYYNIFDSFTEVLACFQV